ncbi:hypothetical protein FUT84_03770 [Treponema phagedenis]|nr:hypothetical protein FUT84_03770 [Treponema phagedenis]QEK05389.1 hypothetical protein FUT80_00685 [Treponema phagedenis]
MSDSEPPWTVVVPSRSDVLKQGRLQSFQTRRFHFAMDGKNQNGHGRPWFHTELSLKTTAFV